MGLAKRFPDAHFIGLDLAKNNLSIAHSLAKYHGIKNVELIESRINEIREPDNVEKHYQDYINTENLSDIWGMKASIKSSSKSKTKQPSLLG